MISWSDIKQFQNQKKDLQLKVEEFLNAKNKEIYNIDDLKLKILELDKNIKELLLINHGELTKFLNNKGTATRSFYEIKDKYKKISKMKVSISKMLEIIESYQKENKTPKI